MPSTSTAGREVLQKSLITIAPRILLRPNIHVWVLYPFFKWWHMFPVLPMLIPQVPCVEGGNYQTRNCDTSIV